MAAQLMATKGASARREPWWMALATRSLPVPLSPCRSTEETSEPATLRARSSISETAGERPMIWEKFHWRARSLRTWPTSRRSSCASMPLRMVTRSSSRLTGLPMKSYAPPRSAEMVFSTSTLPVTMTTTASG